jgi:hypothetical protein
MKRTLDVSSSPKAVNIPKPLSADSRLKDCQIQTRSKYLSTPFEQPPLTNPFTKLVNDPPSQLNHFTHARMHLLKYVVPCSVDSREYLFPSPLLPHYAPFGRSVVLHLFAVYHLPPLLLLLLLLFHFLPFLLLSFFVFNHPFDFTCAYEFEF